MLCLLWSWTTVYRALTTRTAAIDVGIDSAPIDVACLCWTTATATAAAVSPATSIPTAATATTAGWASVNAAHPTGAASIDVATALGARVTLRTEDGQRDK